jgi:hypothetical protein
MWDVRFVIADFGIQGFGNSSMALKRQAHRFNKQSLGPFDELPSTLLLSTSSGQAGQAGSGCISGKQFET